MQKRHRSVVAAAVLLSAALLSGCQWWGQVGFSAARTRFHPFEKAIGVDDVDQLIERWSVPLGGVVGDPVVFGSGRRGTRVFVNANETDLATFHAVGARTGARRWSVEEVSQHPGSDLPVTRRPGAVVGGVVYTGIERQVFPTAIEGHLDAFDAVSGDPVWTGTVPFSGGVFGPPAVAGGRVFVDYFFFCCLGERRVGGFATWDATTGEQGWIGEWVGGYIGASSVTVSGRSVYQVGQPDGEGPGLLSAFDASGNRNCEDLPEGKACRAVWSGWIGAVTTVESSPAVSGGVVYVGSDDNKLYAFDADGCGAATCEPLWTAATGGDIESSPPWPTASSTSAPEDDKLYAFAADGCGAATCRPLWTATTGNNVDSSPAVANGVVYVGSDDNKLYAFAARGCGAATCEPLWTAATGGDIDSSPTLGNRMVYVGSADGHLYAFGLPT